ncbi:MAG: YhbY family RNA-binding protein, partial [Magnetococcales bacterium]|nr:YhbY family RNA-binding protein [Magnetococcales bacterium]
MGLLGWQRKYLRGLAHSLRPVVLVGHGGLSAALLEQVDQALTAHELIKVRFNDFKEERRTLTLQLEQGVACEAVGLIGHTAILYRARPDPAQRSIHFDKKEFKKKKENKATKPATRLPEYDESSSPDPLSRKQAALPSERAEIPESEIAGRTPEKSWQSRSPRSDSTGRAPEKSWQS